MAMAPLTVTGLFGDPNPIRISRTVTTYSSFAEPSSPDMVGATTPRRRPALNVHRTYPEAQHRKLGARDRGPMLDIACRPHPARGHLPQPFSYRRREWLPPDLQKNPAPHRKELGKYYPTH